MPSHRNCLKKGSPCKEGALLEPLDLVPELRSRFKLQVLGRAEHLFLELVDH